MSSTQIVENVIIDEPEYLKNLDIAVNTTLVWLAANFYINLTATSTLTGAEDSLGFMRLIESRTQFKSGRTDQEAFRILDIENTICYKSYCASILIGVMIAGV